VGMAISVNRRPPRRHAVDQLAAVGEPQRRAVRALHGEQRVGDRGRVRMPHRAAIARNERVFSVAHALTLPETRPRAPPRRYGTHGVHDAGAFLGRIAPRRAPPRHPASIVRLRRGRDNSSYRLTTARAPRIAVVKPESVSTFIEENPKVSGGSLLRPFLEMGGGSFEASARGWDTADHAKSVRDQLLENATGLKRP
jgi:hypothetical protein